MSDATNPVVMLDSNVWHIVESSRTSTVALCGKPLRQPRAHSCLQTVGREHVCSDCLRVSDDRRLSTADCRLPTADR